MPVPRYQPFPFDPFSQPPTGDAVVVPPADDQPQAAGKAPADPLDQLPFLNTAGESDEQRSLGTEAVTGAEVVLNASATPPAHAAAPEPAAKPAETATPAAGAQASPEQQNAIYTALSSLSSRLDTIEAETAGRPDRVVYYSNQLQELTTELIAAPESDVPDLRLATLSTLLGCWRDRESVDKLYAAKIVPLLTNPDGSKIKGFEDLTFVEHELVGALMQSSEDEKFRVQALDHFGDDERYKEVMARFDSPGLSPKEKRTLKIAATGILAGASVDHRADRLDDLKRLLLA